MHAVMLGLKVSPKATAWAGLSRSETVLSIVFQPDVTGVQLARLVRESLAVPPRVDPANRHLTLQGCPPDSRR